MGQSHAKKRFNEDEAAEDGLIGLERAAATFDETKGVEFETWAKQKRQRINGEPPKIDMAQKIDSVEWNAALQLLKTRKLLPHHFLSYHLYRAGITPTQIKTILGLKVTQPAISMAIITTERKIRKSLQT